ncbi:MULTISPECIES: hypothetical protein [unclassified Bifidobacterium]|uniref:hypothetical protein n=1 Tax=unclassified Bifidobacterium TaxID=2608897 RepID=UPI0023F621F9|nr:MULTISPECIES: hypothetical protein [unclassified Bifidobacterium]WEV65931.1 hypothetical protein OZX71_00760 [Bifidobacterium sp. ESL0764]WEV75283.1 hypothetical protein OZX75_06515 [Bifidobacterium sp. ESL0800]
MMRNNKKILGAMSASVAMMACLALAGPSTAYAAEAKDEAPVTIQVDNIHIEVQRHADHSVTAMFSNPTCADSHPMKGKMTLYDDQKPDSEPQTTEFQTGLLGCGGGTAVQMFDNNGKSDPPRVSIALEDGTDGSNVLPSIPKMEGSTTITFEGGTDGSGVPFLPKMEGTVTEHID